MPVKAGIHMEGIPMPRFTEGVRLCEKPLKCHREDPDEVGKRGDLKNSKEQDCFVPIKNIGTRNDNPLVFTQSESFGPAFLHWMPLVHGITKEQN